MPETKNRDDQHDAEYLALLFRERAAWSVVDLAGEGFLDPQGLISRPSVIAYLGREGLLLQVVDGQMVHAMELPPRTRMILREEASRGKSTYHAFGKIDERVGMTIRLREPTLLVGPTGSGKSEKAELLIKSFIGREPYIMSLHGEMSVDDFFGTKELVDGDTVFRPGPALRAMQERVPLVINELDAAPAEILFCLQRLLERKAVCLTFQNDEEGRPMVIDPWHDAEGERSNFTVVATANTLGRGDMSGLYRGTQVLNEAFLDRWWVFPIQYPTAQQEEKILMRRTGIQASIAERMISVAQLARQRFERGRELNTTFSVRKTLKWATAMTRLKMSCEQAYAMAVLAGAVEEDRHALAEMFQRVFGTPVSLDCLQA